MDIETKVRLIALKKAAIVMNALAESMKDESTKSETKSLAWTITWAVNEIEKYSAGSTVAGGAIDSLGGLDTTSHNQ